ncbi:hypothetical protein K438DRAFT_1767950 [Mycena galopus ATCC 62051]|nr:hypothetical protein K438DRAFT_1767950 [Mycena galopus ATCC 62051]
MRNKNTGEIDTKQRKIEQEKRSAARSQMIKRCQCCQLHSKRSAQYLELNITAAYLGWRSKQTAVMYMGTAKAQSSSKESSRHPLSKSISAAKDLKHGVLSQGGAWPDFGPLNTGNNLKRESDSHDQGRMVLNRATRIFLPGESMSMNRRNHLIDLVEGACAKITNMVTIFCRDVLRIMIVLLSVWLSFLPLDHHLRHCFGITSIGDCTNVFTGQSWTDPTHTKHLVIYYDLYTGDVSSPLLDTVSPTGLSWYSLLTWKLETSQITSLSNPDACIDLANSVSTAGNQLQVWSCIAGNINQNWVESDN